MASDIREIKAKDVCDGCIGDPYLGAIVRQDGEDGICAYCGKTAACISVSALSELVEAVFDEWFERTSDEPNDSEYALLRDEESDYWWDRAGQTVIEIVGDVAKIDDAIASDLQAVLEDRHFDLDLAKSGGELEYSSEAQYSEVVSDSGDWDSKWDEFRRSIRSESRFFNPAARQFLEALFDGDGGLARLDGATVVLEAGPGNDVNSVVRARCFEVEARMRDALAHPEAELGPPGPEKATGGRMSARGVSVFYGAFDATTAIAEVRPPIGSYVVLASFEIVRPIRLLDLEGLRGVWNQGSYFDPELRSRRERLHYLRGLSRRIARPVVPSEEDLEYVATQAVCDYLGNLSSLQLDGIVYPSVQRGGASRNVVLFHKSARVMPSPDPADIQVTVQYSGRDEDDPGTFFVERQRPQRVDPARIDEPRPRVMVHAPLLLGIGGDDRPTTLRLNRESMKVHWITAHVVTTEERDVVHTDPEANGARVEL